METPIKNEGPELAIQSTPTALRISTPSHATRQSIPCENRTNVLLNRTIQGIPEDEFYAVQDNVNEALAVIYHLGDEDVRSKRSWLSKLPRIICFINRARDLMPWVAAPTGTGVVKWMAAVDERLKEASERICRAREANKRPWGDLVDIVLDADDLLREAGQMLKDACVIDQRVSEGGLDK